VRNHANSFLPRTFICGPKSAPGGFNGKPLHARPGAFSPPRPKLCSLALVIATALILCDPKAGCLIRSHRLSLSLAPTPISASTARRIGSDSEGQASTRRTRSGSIPAEEWGSATGKCPAADISDSRAATSAESAPEFAPPVRGKSTQPLAETGRSENWFESLQATLRNSQAER
jgi:hypothetical protein